MTTLFRTNAQHADFTELVSQLDADLAVRDGRDHAFYSQFNKLDLIKYAVVAYLDDQPCGCGAIKAFDPKTMEIKRMFVKPQHRGKRVAFQLLTELEQWAAELGYDRCVLETGYKQPEAISLYEKSGYQIIPNYGQYAGVANSVCFEKRLKE
ncbi:MAG: GNAT family N-acetyltransferase [Marinoscillum sp.]|uniref:GNAT family N-acetyltransferase n=1 Tax=Marinoscillum sp. TaxID=2024838 RepID=UPI003304F0EE